MLAVLVVVCTNKYNKKEKKRKEKKRKEKKRKEKKYRNSRNSFA